MVNTIAIVMNKGGVGKTSLINNLVGALVTTYNKKVLLLDTDGQGNLGSSFGLTTELIEKTIFDGIVSQTDVNELIVHLNDKIDIIPANSNMNFVEFDVLPKIHKYNQPFNLIKNLLAPIKDNYDFIFIDTPPAMGLIIGNVLVASNNLIIPYVPELFAVNGLVRVQEAIQDFKKDHNPDLNILGILGMMVDSRTTLHQQMLQQARAYCYENNIHMFETVIPRSIRFASSNLKGEPATWLYSNNHLVSAYFNVLEELIERGDILV